MFGLTVFGVTKPNVCASFFQWIAVNVPEILWNETRKKIDKTHENEINIEKNTTKTKKPKRKIKDAVDYISKTCTLFWIEFHFSNRQTNHLIWIESWFSTHFCWCIFGDLNEEERKTRSKYIKRKEKRNYENLTVNIFSAYGIMVQ